METRTIRRGKRRIYLPPRRSKLLWQRIALAALTGGTARVQALSRPAALRFGAGLGRLAYRVAGRQRRRADNNLRLAFGDELSAAGRDALIRRVFVHFGKCIVEFVRDSVLTPADLDRLVVCEGEERLHAALGAGRGLIILTAHFGNWELLGRWLAAHGVRLTVAARDPEGAGFSAYLRRMRENAGFSVLSKGSSARGLLSVLRRGEAIALLPDQNSGDLFVPFFGVPAGTVAGPAALALHTGATLLPTYCLRQPDDTYRLEFLPPIAVEKTSDHDADVARIMSEANCVLERAIRRHPDQWLWLHNRWKSAFEAENRPRWPDGYHFAEAQARWQGL